MPIYCDICESPITREEEVSRRDGSDYCTICWVLVTPIKGCVDITAYLAQLASQGWMYHLDDDPRDIKSWSHPCGRAADPPSGGQLNEMEMRSTECLYLDPDWTWRMVSALQNTEPLVSSEDSGH